MFPSIPKRAQEAFIEEEEQYQAIGSRVDAIPELARALRRPLRPTFYHAASPIPLARQYIEIDGYWWGSYRSLATDSVTTSVPTVVKVDPSTMAVVLTIPVATSARVLVSPVVYDGSSLFVVCGNSFIKIDPTTGRVVESVSAAAILREIRISVDSSYVWAVRQAGAIGYLVRYTKATKVVDEFQIFNNGLYFVTSVFSFGGSVWVGVSSATIGDPGILYRMNPTTGAVISSVPDGGSAIDFAAAGSDFWITVQGLSIPNPGLRKVTVSGFTIGSPIAGTETAATVVYDSTTDSLYASNSSSVFKVNPNTSTLVGTASVANNNGSMTLWNGFLYTGVSSGSFGNSNDSLARINKDTMTVAETIPLSAASSKGVFDGYHLWISDSFSGRIYRFNPITGEVKTLSLGGAPQGMVFDGVYLWVCNSSSNSLQKVEPNDVELVSTIPLPGASPQQVVYVRDKLWVLHGGASGNLSVINPATQAVEATPSAGMALQPEFLVSTPEYVVVLSDTTAPAYVFGFDAVTLEKCRSISQSAKFTGIIYDGEFLWVCTNNNTVQLFDPSTFSPAGSSAISIAFAGVGSTKNRGVIAGQGIVIVADGAPVYIKYNRISLSLAPSNGVASPTFGSKPTAMISDGINVWMYSPSHKALLRVRPVD